MLSRVSCHVHFVPALVALLALGACSADGASPKVIAGQLPPDAALPDATSDAAARDVQPGKDAARDVTLRDADAAEAAVDAQVEAAPPFDASTSSLLGGHYDPARQVYTFAVRSEHATRVEVDLFAEAQGAGAVLTRVATQAPGSDVFEAAVSAAEIADAGVGATVYYGYRAWGPNWPYASGWSPGSSVGFVSSWDKSGNAFDPNKLLIDPFTREISHDPLTPASDTPSVYSTTKSNLAKDSAPSAPKSIVLTDGPYDTGARPSRALTDDIIYEVHVRGFTENDPSVTSCAGTFQAAAQKASWLGSLGVTAIELLPIMEAQNDLNDVAQSTSSQDYWGYSTLAFFSVDRRYACDQSPGGPTREFAAFVKAMHDAGIKVFLDAVYNHTAEGGAQQLLSWRGLDNGTYYEIADGGAGFADNTGCGANVNVANPVVADMILQSLRYFSSTLGVDGFRFDEASELGNSCASGCYAFDPASPGGLLQQIVAAIPGSAIIAEPWATGAGTDQLGHFPAGWSEWNGNYRDGVRTLENKLGVVATPMSALQDEWSGSPSLYASRTLASSINYVVCHDGFTLRDEFSCSAPDNTQGWPYGPSNGGASDETQWNQGGNVDDQEQAERVAIALLATSAGVPMIGGGDELGRTVKCNDNPFNVDSAGNWLDWPDADSTRTAFVSGAFATRAAHPSLRPSQFRSGTDHNGNGMPDVAWLTATGATADATYLADTTQTFLAFEIDASEYGESDAAVMVAYNSDDAEISWTLPAAPSGTSWYVAMDTSYQAGKTAYVTPPGQEIAVNGSVYALAGRTVALLVAK